ncbi:MAG: hypothetical protein ACRC76_09990 [Proteocatella sp.]
MAETYRAGRLMKFVESIRILKNEELKQNEFFYNNLKNNIESKLEESYNTEDIIDIITKISYEKGQIDFSHTEYLFLKEYLFHLGYIRAAEDIIKHTGSFFDLNIPELNNNKWDIDKYNIRPIDTTDYTNVPTKLYILVGGMGEAFSEEVENKISEICTNILIDFVDEESIEKMDNGFVIETAVQNIPIISSKLMKNNIGIYGIIPIK